MSEQIIRPYSMLIYGLQDDFIGVLKPASLESKGHITDPKMVLKNDGTQELEFSIPMYYTEPTTGRRITNPMWARTRDAELLANLRKIKVVFHPVEDDEKERVYEFVITSKTDKHTNGTLECEIKCEGLAFRELGGTGYKLSLTQDDFLVEYNNDFEELDEAQTKLNEAQAKYEEFNDAWIAAKNEQAVKQIEQRELAEMVLSSNRTYNSKEIKVTTEDEDGNSIITIIPVTRYKQVGDGANAAKYIVIVDNDGETHEYNIQEIPANGTIIDYVNILGAPVDGLRDKGIYGAQAEALRGWQQEVQFYYPKPIYDNIINTQGTVLYYAAQDDDIAALRESEKESLKKQDIKLPEEITAESEEGQAMIQAWKAQKNTWINFLTPNADADGKAFFSINELRTILGSYISGRNFPIKNEFGDIIVKDAAQVSEAFSQDAQSFTKDEVKRLKTLLRSSELSKEIVKEIRDIVERLPERSADDENIINVTFGGGSNSTEVIKGLKAVARYINLWQAYGTDTYMTNGFLAEDGQTYQSAIYYYNSIASAFNQLRGLEAQLENSSIISDYENYKNAAWNNEQIQIRLAILGSDENTEGSIEYFNTKASEEQLKVNAAQKNIEQIKNRPEKVMSINYWCDKVFDGSTPWTYEVRMNWEESGRESYKVYEDAYVSSWTTKNNSLIAEQIKEEQEKYRAIDCVDSNRYNIVQAIAEAFGVYCRYEYEHDEAYHIVGRKVIFYNNFFAEDGKIFDINYPYHTNSVEREIESQDIVTKMYVKDIEDATQVSGIISITETEANKSGEDYILNFDYLHSIGSITEEQYAAVPKFEAQMHDLNAVIKNYNERLIEINNALPKYEAQVTNANEARINAQEQINEAKMAKAACLSGNANGIAYRGGFNEDTGVWTKGVFGAACSSSVAVEKPSTNEPVLTPGYNYRARIPDEGVLPETISLFYMAYNYDTKKNDGHLIPQYNGGNELDLDPNWVVIYDTTGDVLGVDLKGQVFKDITLKTLYWSYKYKPSLKYELIEKTYNLEFERQNSAYNEAKEKVETYTAAKKAFEQKLKDEMKKKEQALKEFQRLMGAAIKEGNWQDDTYKDYGKQEEVTLDFFTKTDDDDVMPPVYLFWDDEPIKGENLCYKEKGTSQTETYYPLIEITNELLESIGSISYAQFKNNLNNIFICYKVHPTNGNTKDDVIYTIGPNAGFTYQFLTIGGTAPKLYAVINDDKFLTNYEESNLEAHKTEITDLFFAQMTIHSTATNTGYEFDITYDKFDTVLNSGGGTTTLKFTKENIIMPSTTLPVNVYPRVGLTMDNLKTSADKFILTLQNKKLISGSVAIISEEILEIYAEYSLLTRDFDETGKADDGWYVTPKVDKIISFCGENWHNFGLKLNYEVSNASTCLYVDALEVMKTNAFPQISYKISVSKLPERIIRALPDYLNAMIYINDPELFLDEVTGYISELELKLDAPWDDTVTTKDYKTKFEDLFASIVASTAQMQSNGAAYDAAAAAFSVSGDGVLINEATLQNSLHHYNLSQQYQNGKLTISDDGIIALSDAGAVAMSGGGIFCATEKDLMERWIWNTGIVPEGINASMITAGHLDTNHISIYSGDNVALQMNANGLFAYRDYFDEEGNRQYYNETYVVHNDEGLFFHTPKEGTDKGIDRVEISWDGLIMRDNEGNKVLYADDSGHLMINNATIDNATISNLKIANIETLDKGVTFTPTKGVTFKYDRDTKQFVPNNLNFSIALAYVHWNPEDRSEIEAFQIFRSFDENPNWDEIDQTINVNLYKDSGHLTLTLNSDIMKDENGDVHDSCNIRIVTSCLQDRDNSYWIDSKYFTLLAISDGENGEDGADGSGITVVVTSDKGEVITDDTLEDVYTLTAKVYQTYGEIDLDGTSLHYKWINSKEETICFGKILTIKATDINFSETYYCEVTEGGTIVTQPVSGGYKDASEKNRAAFTIKVTAPVKQYKWQYLKTQASEWTDLDLNNTFIDIADDNLSCTLRVLIGNSRTDYQWRCVVIFEDDFEMISNVVKFELS